MLEFKIEKGISEVARMATTMNMQETSRLILALRAKGWDDTSINDLILYLETGDERYKPTAD